MSKKRLIVFFVIVLILTNITTFSLSNSLSLQLNSKVVIPKTDYDYLKSTAKEFSKVQLVESLIKESYLKDVDNETLREGQLKGIVASLGDPYSQYLTADEYTDLSQQTSGEYGGIGVIVTPGEDNLITVVSPIKGTPGEVAGIKPEDKIIAVDGKEFMAEDMDKAVKIMKGKPKTKVVLTILRKNKDGSNKTFDLDIVREKIRLETVNSSIVDDNIGYINITSFDELTYKDFMKDLKKLQGKDVKGLIIDLRNNPGGLLDVTADIADELLGEGTIVYTETKGGEKEYYKSKPSQIDIPLVVLVNGGSASASEILSGAIKDYKRGELIGTKTFGKGIVQRIRPLPTKDGSAIKLTISEYFTPNGTNIHGIGIEPDIVVELPEDIKVIGVENLKEDTQLKKALEVIKEKIK
ncbi:S41 family peptidase [Tissierella creatinophila]|uniref:Carboxy-terminal processing protease CtpB n=1 Tax=Tissierella creatinophila DSM 6911 TaxID=1123403 RepID=A0A1U7M775_TISCR|nr:S41 family peptidase [Tissierella creatinophila]OLS03048.1 carboxy-terminal processing protease CtpB precursor [Tissierella creatinophila DSM 6911]